MDYKQAKKYYNEKGIEVYDSASIGNCPYCDIPLHINQEIENNHAIYTWTCLKCHKKFIEVLK